MKDLFLTEPYLLTLNPSIEMNVLWLLREPIQGLVEYGSTKELGNCVETECYEIKGLRLPASQEGYEDVPEKNPHMQVWQCIARIENLMPGERVYYRCRAGEECTQVYEFHTAPKPGESFRFVQISDLQCLPACNETVYHIGNQQPDFILFSGDAAYHSWRADQWFDLKEPWQEANEAKRAFFPCMQQLEGARLMQFAPTFLCPGNHEMDDMRYGIEKEFSLNEKNWNWSIYMQLFRPLYPQMNTTSSGKRWYSVDYGDLHILSLSINRWAMWDAHEYPGWRLFDSIAPDSRQIQWLEQDLQMTRTKFKWVIHHWHILNKGYDVQDYLCQPMISEAGEVAYPDDHGGQLMELYEKYGVNAVSYGHSHVYERYFHNGTHYIEAARISAACYREKEAELHPSGLLPVVEDNSKRSFLVLERRTGGLFASGYYAEENLEIFDEYQIADESGLSVILERM